MYIKAFYFFLTAEQQKDFLSKLSNFYFKMSIYPRVCEVVDNQSLLVYILPYLPKFFTSSADLFAITVYHPVPLHSLWQWNVWHSWIYNTFWIQFIFFFLFSLKPTLIKLSLHHSTEIVLVKVVRVLYAAKFSGQFSIFNFLIYQYLAELIANYPLRNYHLSSSRTQHSEFSPTIWVAPSQPSLFMPLFSDC